MLFSLLQYSVADKLGISHIIVVSLQNVGGSLGNMINIQKIITACAVVGLMGVEGLIMKRSIIPMLFALLITGIIGLILVFFVVPGLF
jgi:lactate permease